MAISRSASADYEIIFDIRTCRYFEIIKIIIKIKQGEIQILHLLSQQLFLKS